MKVISSTTIKVLGGVDNGKDARIDERAQEEGCGRKTN